MKDYTLYVTEEIAKKAMEKGFKFTYANEYEIRFNEEHLIGSIFLIPTAEQICGWLEDKFHILPLSILCYEGNGICWTPQIMRTLYDGNDEFRSVNDDLDEFDFQTRHEALFKAIDKALDLI